MKIYKAYELLKSIKNGEIKDYTKFQEIHSPNFKIQIINKHLYKLDGTIVALNINDLLEMEFEIISEKIEIQNILELNTTSTPAIVVKINEILQAVKEMDKKIKEKK